VSVQSYRALMPPNPSIPRPLPAPTSQGPTRRRPEGARRTYYDIVISDIAGPPRWQPQPTGTKARPTELGRPELGRGRGNYRAGTTGRELPAGPAGGHEPVAASQILVVARVRPALLLGEGPVDRRALGRPVFHGHQAAGPQQPARGRLDDAD